MVERIRKGIEVGYGFIMPYPLPGLQMPPDIKGADLLRGKEDAEEKTRRERIKKS